MNSIKGYILIGGSVFSFAIMSSLVKLIPQVDSTITTFYRFAIGLGILGILALTKKIKLSFNNSPLLFLRGLTGGIAVFLLYFSIVNIGVGKATIYVYSYPIFATILSVIIFKEKVNILQWIFIFLAFFGIILLSVNKGLDFSGITLFELLAIIGGVFSAISVVIVKKLHNTDISTSIFFSQSLMGFWLFLLPSNLPSNLHSNFQGNWQTACILIAIGVISAVGQLIMTEGYRHVNISKGSVMQLAVPVLNIFIGFWLFNEILTLKEWLGAFLVIFSCLGVISAGNLIKIKSSTSR